MAGMSLKGNIRPPEQLFLLSEYATAPMTIHLQECRPGIDDKLPIRAGVPQDAACGVEWLALAAAYQRRRGAGRCVVSRSHIMRLHHRGKSATAQQRQ
jgi:hypothetical protein